MESALPLISCLTLSKLLKLSDIQIFSLYKMGRIISIFSYCEN